MQKSLPADTSEKEIFKNALTHNKNKINHSGQTRIYSVDSGHWDNKTAQGITTPCRNGG